MCSPTFSLVVVVVVLRVVSLSLDVCDRKKKKKVHFERPAGDPTSQVLTLVPVSQC